MPELPEVTPGEFILAEEQNLVIRRTVQRYADQAARDSSNPTPQSGDLSYLNDSGQMAQYTESEWRLITNDLQIRNDGNGYLWFLPENGTTDSGWLLRNHPGGATFSIYSYVGGARMLQINSNGSLYAQDGGAVTPAWSFANYPNMGMWVNSANLMGIGAAGQLNTLIGGALHYIDTAITNVRMQGVAGFPTTGTAGNLFISPTTGQLFLSTSALEFKDEVEPVVGLADMEIPSPIQWRDKEQPDTEDQARPVLIGYAADDWAALDARFGMYNADGDLYNYSDRAAMAVMGEHIKALEARVAALEA